MGLQFLAIGVIWAGSSVDLSGSHRDLSRCDSRDGTTSGPDVMANCYEGFAHEQGSNRFELVQNGPYICGTFQGCGGWNCSKVFGGDVVGRVHSRSVTLYWSDGHIENGEANTETFRVSSMGELSIPGTKRKRTYTKTTLSLENQKAKELCHPQFSTPVQIKDYELDIEGSRPKISWEYQRGKPVFTPPPAKNLKLKSDDTSQSFSDRRGPSGNLIPRVVWIDNTTDIAWNISVGLNDYSEFGDEACAKWLQSSERGKKLYVWAYNKSSAELLPPKSKRYTRVCAGDTLELERDMPQ